MTHPLDNSSSRWGVEPSLDDLVWMIENIPGYSPSEEQKTQYRAFKEQQKVKSWLQRQELQEVPNFKEPFDGFFAGTDLWPDGAPAKYYQSLENRR